jgi:outer membrane protein TolC
MRLTTYLLILLAALRALHAAQSDFSTLPEPPLQPPSAPSPQATNALTLSLEEVEAAVLRDNPSLKAARANWEAMKQRVPQARAWEDARLGFETVVGRFVSIPPNSFTDQKLVVEQAIPLSGKNRFRGEAAEAEAAAAFGEFRRRELDLITKARTLYYRLANAYQQLQLNDVNTTLLQQFAQISRRKYEAGTALESDVLLAETDLSKLHEARADILRQVSDAESQLNVVLNRAAQSPLPHPADLRPPPFDFQLAPLQILALTNRPELFMAAKKIQAAEARLGAARRERIPDPSLMVEASRYNDAGQPISELDVGAAINLPWFNHRKYKAAIEEARQMKVASEFELESARKETSGLVRDALSKVQTFHHHVELFRDRLIPLARQNITATRSAYETDKTGFLNLIDAQRTLQEAEAMYWNHLTEYLTGLAELESVLGADPRAATEPHHQH